MDNIWIIAFIAFIIGVFYIEHKTNIYWKMVGRKKWKELQPEIQTIKKINDETKIKKVNWLNRKAYKSKLDTSKTAYVEYLDFCDSKHLAYPDIKQELDCIIEETEDALLSPDEVLDKELLKTEQQYDDVYNLVNTAGEKLLKQRQNSVSLIEDVENLVNSIARHPKTFETDIQQIVIQKEKFKNTIEFSLEQRKALETSARSAGAGLAAGTAVASMAPTAAMWVATTFGTASTGTAISALSGAAATNAALAWLGGGALAAGGGGMAAGQSLLALAGPIGWGVAGTSLAASIWFGWRKKQKIKESKRDQIVYMKNYIEALKETKGKIDSLSIETTAIFDNLQIEVMRCQELQGRDYMTFSNEQKQRLGALVNNTKSLSALLNKTVTE